MRREIFSLLLFLALLTGLCMLFLSVKIMASPSSAAPSEVVAVGDGAETRKNIIYQSIHSNSRADDNGHQVTWSGDVRAIYIDNLENQHLLWSASQQLSSLKDVVTQRNYMANANTGRYIFTYLDLDGDGAVSNSEVKPFTPSTFPSDVFGILDVPDRPSAEALVNYIRGDESQNTTRRLRNRSLNLDNNDTAEVMRLGDIIHSNAVEVGAPAEAYDLLYGDASYGRFRKQYSERRRVVYVGANDGMVHAFNAGFYDDRSHSYKLLSDSSNTRHPLGSELWAYVPYNLLPQLKQLQAPEYDHVWYVDGRPRVFDARIFADDQTHPGGWGTILVMGMRFGGSRTVLDTAKNREAFSAWTSRGAAAASIQCQSAYVVMDITDPETTPTVIAEVTDPSNSMGYTVSQPALVAFNSPTQKSSAPSRQWYLVFGSGPDLAQAGNAIAAKAESSAKLYAYDLVKKKFTTHDDHLYLYDLGDDPADGAPGSFVGDPVAVDWDLNYHADAVYFGTIGGNESAPTGKVFKLDFRPFSGTTLEDESTAPVVLADIKNPVTAAPAVTRDEYNNHWIIGGTGRLYTDSDANSTQVQNIFAVIDDLPMKEENSNNLIETSDAVDTQTGTLEGVPEATTPDQLAKLIRARGGWKRTLKAGTSAASERSIEKIFLLGDTLFVTSVIPGDASNPEEGKSHLYCLNYKTGMPAKGATSCGKPSSAARGGDPAKGVMDLGPGLTMSLALYRDPSTDSGLLIFTRTSSGIVNQSSSTIPPNTRSSEIDWREIH